MPQVGGLTIPDEMLVRRSATCLLSKYLGRDDSGRYRYSGAAFDTYGNPGRATADKVTDDDLIALTMLSIRVNGHEALAITQYHADEIHDLLAAIPSDAHIEDPDAPTYWLPKTDGPARKLWDLLRDIKDPSKRSRLGEVAAGKLLARKRPNLIPIWDSLAGSALMPAGGQGRWWDNVRSAALDKTEVADGMTLWEYLNHLRLSEPLATHLPVLRVLDILSWMLAQPSSLVRRMPQAW